MELNERLKKLRKEIRATQAQVAQIIDVDRSNYTSYESGRRTPPADKLDKLADFFGVSVDYLLGRTDERSTFKPSSDEVNEANSLLDTYILKQYYKIKNDALNGNPTAIKTLNELDAILRIKGSGNDD